MVQRNYWPTETWQYATPQQVDMDASMLEQIYGYTSTCIPHIHSLLIVRHGYLVFEEYYHGFQQQSYLSISSATKSIISALVGMALSLPLPTNNAQSFITSLDQHVLDFFPEYASNETDPRKQALTLRHLLSLTGGFSHEFPENYHLDPVRLALARPMLHWPGQQFYYDSQGVDILSGILTRATGRNAATFAYETLFKTLGIWQEDTARFAWKTDPAGANIWHEYAYFDEKDGFLWKIDPQGNNPGGFGIHLTAREMAKIGYLYLNNGLWDGKQVIPADYVAESTRQHSEGGPPVNLPYGYLWWITQHGSHAAFFASGYGGKCIYVIPSLDLVFVSTGSSTQGPQSHFQEILERFILPAIMQ